MIALGILSGLSGISFLQTLGSTLSEIFIRIFKCLSTPIIALSLIVTLSTFTGGAMTKIWFKTIYYTVSTTLIAATTSCVLYLLIHPKNITAVVNAAPLSSNTSYSHYISTLIPANFLAPFLENQVIGVLIIGLVVGLAITQISDVHAKKAVTDFFRGLHGILFVITKWVVKILPLGLFGFITVSVVQLSQGKVVAGIGEYLLVIVLANLVQGIIILPLWLMSKNISPFESMKKMMPALSVAFFSKSSAGTLPVTINTAEKGLNIHPKISRFVLPLCTTLNMNGCAAFIFATVIYVMQNNGVDITLTTMAGWIIIATIAAIGNAGVPMGCFLLSASLLSSMNIPIVLLGIILPFYGVIDMVETALNVWSDSCVANMINKTHQFDLDDKNQLKNWVVG